jgi:hypothetical protein
MQIACAAGGTVVSEVMTLALRFISQAAETKKP